MWCFWDQMALKETIDQDSQTLAISSEPIYQKVALYTVVYLYEQQHYGKFNLGQSMKKCVIVLNCYCMSEWAGNTGHVGKDWKVILTAKKCGAWSHYVLMVGKGKHRVRYGTRYVQMILFMDRTHYNLSIRTYISFMDMCFTCILDLRCYL